MGAKTILSRWPGFAIAAAVCLLMAPAQSAELVMFESLTCHWCQRWHEEVGPIYPKTPESQCAPLRRVDIDDPRPADLAEISPIVFTPTFVVVDGGKEVARLVGYPGEDFFWPLLARELVKLPEPCPN
ncbi:MAG: thioredoxin fold domain-containing protein [Rhodospirillales bacterium]